MNELNKLYDRINECTFKMNATSNPNFKKFYAEIISDTYEQIEKLNPFTVGKIVFNEHFGIGEIVESVNKKFSKIKFNNLKTFRIIKNSKIYIL